MKFAKVYIIGNGVFGQLLHRRITQFYGAEVCVFDKGDKLDFSEATPEKPNLIIVATPISEILKVIETVVAINPINTWLTEIGSAKGKLFCNQCCYAIGTKMPFLSVHPMTGPLDTLWGELNWHRKCLVVEKSTVNDFEEMSTSEVWEKALEIQDFWEDLGFVIRHDRIIGTLSHLSHFMILSYAKFVRATLTPAEIDLAGTSFEKFDKMAKGAERLMDIYKANDALYGITQEFASQMETSLFKLQMNIPAGENDGGNSDSNR